MAHSRRIDLLGLHENVHRRVRNQEITAGTTHVESFIMDPVTIRAWPPAIAVFTASEIFGVALYHTSGGPVTVQYMAGTPGSATVVHTFTSAAANVVHSALGDAMTSGDDYELEPGDIFYPQITAGSGGAITAAFMIS